ncbi:unnamed protein product [Alopecurus aequalis]
MSGAGGGGDHGGGQRYGDHHQPADDDDVGSMFFQNSPSGTGAVEGGLTPPSYSSITDYLQGFLDPAGLARHLDGPTGEAVHRGSGASDVIIGRAGPAAAATPNSSTTGEAGRGKKGRPALVKDEDDEEGSADHQDSRSGTKKKKEKKARGSRVAFATKSEVDHLDDGYRWRKYGQKAVKNSTFPRSYYRCTTARCGVKKQVERSQQDPSTVVTTYEGHHAHPSPGAHRGMATGLYSLTSLQQQRHGFCPSSPDSLLLAATGTMAPAAAAASVVALPPHQAERRFAEYYGVQLQDVLLDPLAGNQHGHR